MSSTPWTPAQFSQYLTQYVLSMNAANRTSAVDLYSRLYAAWKAGTGTALELVSSEQDVPGFLTTLGQASPSIEAPGPGVFIILIAALGIAAWMYFKG